MLARDGKPFLQMPNSVLLFADLFTNIMSHAQSRIRKKIVVVGDGACGKVGGLVYINCTHCIWHTIIRGETNTMLSSSYKDGVCSGMCRDFVDYSEVVPTVNFFS